MLRLCSGTMGSDAQISGDAQALGPTKVPLLILKY